MFFGVDDPSKCGHTCADEPEGADDEQDAWYLPCHDRFADGEREDSNHSDERVGEEAGAECGGKLAVEAAKFGRTVPCAAVGCHAVGVTLGGHRERGRIRQRATPCDRGEVHEPRYRQVERRSHGDRARVISQDSEAGCDSELGCHEKPERVEAAGPGAVGDGDDSCGRSGHGERPDIREPGRTEREEPDGWDQEVLDTGPAARLTTLVLGGASWGETPDDPAARAQS